VWIQSPRRKLTLNPHPKFLLRLYLCATLYDGVGSVKRHFDCTSRWARFFFLPDGIFSLSCISTKARFVNPAVETGSTNHLFGHRTSDHDSFFRRRDRSREQGAQSA
jgi:hypothetical protein